MTNSYSGKLYWSIYLGLFVFKGGWRLCFFGKVLNVRKHFISLKTFQFSKVSGLFSNQDVFYLVYQVQTSLLRLMAGSLNKYFICFQWTVSVATDDPAGISGQPGNFSCYWIQGLCCMNKLSCQKHFSMSYASMDLYYLLTKELYTNWLLHLVMMSINRVWKSKDISLTIKYWLLD